MALTPKLEIRQSQSLLMTPQLRQAINLLQLSNLELNELIDLELNNNPLLEKEDSREDEIPGETPPTIEDYDDNRLPEPEDDYTPDIDCDNQFDDYASDREGYDTGNDYAWEDYAKRKAAAADENFDFYEQKLADSPSLYQLIDEQIEQTFSSPRQKIIARHLSQYLDDAGYFRGQADDIARALKAPPQEVRQILEQMKNFEPSGLFAENLAECLSIQLKDINRFDPAIACLLEHLDLLAARKFKELQKLCRADEEDLASMIADIKSLQPKPAAAYQNDITAYVIPDVFVRRDRFGGYQVELNNLSLPRLLINRRYYSEILNRSGNDKDARRYLKENLGHAGFLIRSMHQRATAILRVSEEIVRRQRDFFEYGIEHLKPMSLKDIAYNLEMHESTVSRVTTRKYMQTPRGLFELKYFFSQAAGTYTGNEETSTTAIKHKIKQLIAEEDPQNILSDDKLVELLAREGIKIARRTVAKYREAMNLPTSAERKRQKRLEK